MDLSTDLQCYLFIAKLLVCYTLIMVLVPSLVFGPVLRKYPFPLRMMSYYCIGNVIVVNLVFVLEFLKISNRATLIIFTFLIYYWLFLHIRRKTIRGRITWTYYLVNGIANRVTTLRTVWIKGQADRKAALKEKWKHFVSVFFAHIIEWALLAALVVYAVWEISGTNIAHLGYHASDMPVHTYWINYLDKNRPFVAGIYPMAFHIVVYYMHLVFADKTMNVIMFFGSINFVYVILMLVSTLKYITKTRYLPVLGGFLYASFSYISDYAVGRFTAGLPQEYATIFIFPSVAFAFAFFHYKALHTKVSRFHWKDKLPKIKKERPSLLKKKESLKKESVVGISEEEPRSVAAKAEAPRRFAGAKSAAERREFERIARKIEKEKKKQIQIQDKNKPEAVSEVIGEDPEKAEIIAEIPETNEVIPDIPEKEDEYNKKKKEKPQKPKIPIRERVASFFRNGGIRIRSWLSREHEFVILMFAFAFAMSIAAHFYATIAAAFFYFGMAAGFIIRFIRPRYFLNIIKGIAIGLVIAVLPLGFGYATGIPLEGSLYWALGVISPAEEEEDIETEETPELSEPDEGETVTGESPGAGGGAAVSEVSDTKEDTTAPKVSLITRIKTKAEAYYKRITGRFIEIKRAISLRLDYLGVRFGSGFNISIYIGLILSMLLLEAAVLMIPDREYAMTLLSFAVGIVILLLVFAGRDAGFPELMDYSRALVFLAPFLAGGAVLSIDALIFIIAGWLKWKYTRWIRHALAFSVVALSVFGLYKGGYVRDIQYLIEHNSSADTNGAIICTNRIINENRPFTYTILSPVNDLRMVEPYGYHYETIVLLHRLENVNKRNEQGIVDIYNTDADSLDDPNVFIPTKYVYIYLEKGLVNVNYNGQDYKLVPNEIGARIRVPYGTGINVYQGLNRWVVMSRMREWIKTLEKLYPEAVSLYYSDKDFECYRLIQGSIPFNMGIDYGFNDYNEEFI